MEENNIEKNKNIVNLKILIEERKGMKDQITTCDWCGMTYPKGGWTYYKIRVMNMSLEKTLEQIEKGTDEKFNEKFDTHIICSDCYDHLEICKDC